jgi:hypothetical protein
VLLQDKEDKIIGGPCVVLRPTSRCRAKVKAGHGIDMPERQKLGTFIVFAAHQFQGEAYGAVSSQKRSSGRSGSISRGAGWTSRPACRAFASGTGPRGNYVQMGAHGIYYRASFPAHRARPVPAARTPTPRLPTAAESPGADVK